MTFGLDPRRGLLVDAQLLILFVIGSVNRARIETFKRTRQYTIADFNLLLTVLDRWKKLYTLPHILAEVSNLIDLSSYELQEARQLLKKTISLLDEIQLPSAQAAEDDSYFRLGLTDAAICKVARDKQCSVLTDDLDLFLMLQRDGVQAFKFAHIRAQRFGL